MITDHDDTTILPPSFPRLYERKDRPTRRRFANPAIYDDPYPDGRSARFSVSVDTGRWWKHLPEQIGAFISPWVGYGTLFGFSLLTRRTDDRTAIGTRRPHRFVTHGEPFFYDVSKQSHIQALFKTLRVLLTFSAGLRTCWNNPLYQLDIEEFRNLSNTPIHGALRPLPGFTRVVDNGSIKREDETKYKFRFPEGAAFESVDVLRHLDRFPLKHCQGNDRTPEQMKMEKVDDPRLLPQYTTFRIRRWVANPTIKGPKQFEHETWPLCVISNRDEITIPAECVPQLITRIKDLLRLYRRHLDNFTEQIKRPHQHDWDRLQRRLKLYPCDELYEEYERTVRYTFKDEPEHFLFGTDDELPMPLEDLFNLEGLKRCRSPKWEYHPNLRFHEYDPTYLFVLHCVDHQKLSIQPQWDPKFRMAVDSDIKTVLRKLNGVCRLPAVLFFIACCCLKQEEGQADENEDATVTEETATPLQIPNSNWTRKTLASATSSFSKCFLTCITLRGPPPF